MECAQRILKWNPVIQNYQEVSSGGTQGMCVRSIMVYSDEAVFEGKIDPTDSRIWNTAFFIVDCISKLQKSHRH